jgi:hypothetical protein
MREDTLFAKTVRSIVNVIIKGAEKKRVRELNTEIISKGTEVK